MISAAPSSLIMGPPGSGKTSSLATYGKSGIETFVLFTEPRGEESLLDSITVRVMDYESISKLKSGVEKASMVQFEELLTSIEDFPDDKTQKTFGDVTSWDDSRAFVIDSMSGLNELAWLTTVGYKPTAHEGEWGMAMNLEKELIHKLTSDCRCYFTMTSHIDREADLITGSSRIMAAMLGRKLAPKIPAKFSEVILTRKSTDGFWWSTVDNAADLKNRSLPSSPNLKQDFGLLVSAHTERKALLAA